MLTCSRCGQEVRWGSRDGINKMFLHREDVDHAAILGHILTEEEKAAIEGEYHRTRFMDDGTPYTTAEWDAQRIKNAEKRKAALDDLAPDDEEDTSHELEPIEVRCSPMPEKGDFVVRTLQGAERTATVPGGTRTILNLAKKLGWVVTRLTYARGPYVGSKGKSLGVSDTVVLHIRGPVVDGAPLYGVASWRDGKSDCAYTVTNHQTHRVGARALIAWMKEHPHG